MQKHTHTRTQTWTHRETLMSTLEKLNYNTNQFNALTGRNALICVTKQSWMIFYKVSMKQIYIYIYTILGH